MIKWLDDWESHDDETNIGVVAPFLDGDEYKKD